MLETASGASPNHTVTSSTSRARQHHITCQINPSTSQISHHCQRACSIFHLKKWGAWSLVCHYFIPLSISHSLEWLKVLLEHVAAGVSAAKESDSPPRCGAFKQVWLPASSQRSQRVKHILIFSTFMSFPAFSVPLESILRTVSINKTPPGCCYNPVCKCVLPPSCKEAFPPFPPLNVASCWREIHAVFAPLSVC